MHADIRALLILRSDASSAIDTILISNDEGVSMSINGRSLWENLNGDGGQVIRDYSNEDLIYVKINSGIQRRNLSSGSSIHIQPMVAYLSVW